MRDFRISTECEQKLNLDDDDISLDKSIRLKDKSRSPQNLFRVEGSVTSLGYDDPQMAVLEPKYGFHLIQYFNLYFGGHKKYERYDCDPKRCRVKNIVANYNSPGKVNDESLETEFSNNLKISDSKRNISNHEDFLKQYVSANINFHELCLFIKGGYYAESKFLQFISISGKLINFKYK
jgi:hypothetical protein